MSIYTEVATAPLPLAVAEIRERLPLVYVCATVGIGLDEYGYGTCPWHADTKPSFHLFAGNDGVERYACYPCNFVGDVIDLIQHLLELPSRGAAIAYAADLIDDLPEGYRTEPRKSGAIDVTSWERIVSDARVYAVAQLTGLTTALGIAKDSTVAELWRAHLLDTWGLGFTWGGSVIMPHWSPTYELVGVRERWGTHKRSFPGSDFRSHLYGAWLQRQHPRAVITEGERDAVYLSAQGLAADIYSLPSGASAPRAGWLQLVGHNPVLVFDGDTAGREAAAEWKRELPEAVVVPVPDGADVCSHPEHVINLITEVI